MAVAYNSLLIDHDHRTLHAETRREGVIEARDLLLGIGEQRYVQRVLGRERLVGVEILSGDAHDRRDMSRNCLVQISVSSRAGIYTITRTAKGAEMTGARRAIGIVRVSHVKGRDGSKKGRKGKPVRVESFISPTEQRERIEAECERGGLILLRTADELDVSGKTSLEGRSGLREAIEAGEADVIVAVYFDRLVRSLKVQAELVQRVERAGGKVLAVDVGQATEARPASGCRARCTARWLSITPALPASVQRRRRRALWRAECFRGRTSRPAIAWAKMAYSSPTRSRRRLCPRRSACVLTAPRSMKFAPT